MAALLDNLSVVCGQSNNLSEAVSFSSRSLSIYKANKPVPLVDIAKSLNNLGLLQTRQGKYTEAELAFQDAIEQINRCENPPAGLLGTTQDSFGSLYFAKGDFKKSEELKEQALATLEKSLGPHHPETAKCQHNFRHPDLGTG